MAGEELIEDTKWSGMPGTMKMNENIARVAAVLKDDHRASTRVIAESKGYRQPSFTAFCLILEKTKIVCTICVTCVDSRTMGAARCSRKGLNHAPYSPDLNPSDYFAFLKLKMELKGDRYATISDIQTSVTTKLKIIPITDFSPAMHRLEDLANQCIAVNGDYFELKNLSKLLRHTLCR